MNFGFTNKTIEECLIIQDMIPILFLILLFQITWDNPAELETYINRLQSAADRLTIENRKLRKCHFDIADKVTL